MFNFAAPSKLVGERITLTFSFLNRLLWGETLVSAECSVEVVFGVDAAPNEILYLTPTVSAGKVTQQVYLGLAGVTYLVVCTATSNTGHLYTSVTYLAVLPDDDAPAPLLFSGQIETVEMSSGA